MMMCSNRFPLRLGVVVPIAVLLLLLVGCVTANDKSTTRTATTTITTKVTKAGEGKTQVQHVQVSEGRVGPIRGAKERKATPITYIKTLGVPPVANELHHAEPKLLDQTASNGSSGKQKNGNRFAPKSLDVAHSAAKDLSNAELFSKLGLGRVRPSTNHHRKRLAEESRHHGRPDDSHMYVIKLPPNPYYYAHNVAPQNSIADVGKQVPVGFKSNGKPARIYHWNIPVLKKMLGAKQSRHPNSRRHDDIDELIDIKEIPTWTKPWEGAAAPREKSLLKQLPIGATGAGAGAGAATAATSTGLEQSGDRVIVASKKKFPTYYAPVKKQSSGGGKSKKHTNGKYNTGSNGKPQSFYILGDKESRTKIMSHSPSVAV
ncbi:uncharacterized protein LOC125948807 [Anopheles darlingi]|uniref:uncharacterized protein LOC125948807 n=1 Tax=Anopheles darlingi TaxID=43151 RepID=UPI0021001388|nr:uncharacterized protein LOC125948807 [Anopheles darlingi]